MEDFINFWNDLWNNISTFFTDKGTDGKAMPMYNRIILAVIVLIIGYFLIKLVFALLKRSLKSSKKKRSTSKTAFRFILSCIKTFLYFVLFVSVLSILGINLSGITTVLSSAILAIGVSLQDVIANFAAGIVILSTKLYVEGDYVEINDTIAGTVKEIRMMATILVAPNNILITIPNSTATKGKVTNYNGLETRRLDLVASVAYGTDIDAAKKILKYIVLSDERIRQDMPITIAVKTMNSSSIDFAVRGYCSTSCYWDTLFSLNEKILTEFTNRNVNIPFNQLDVNLYNQKIIPQKKINLSGIKAENLIPKTVVPKKEEDELDEIIISAKKKINRITKKKAPLNPKKDIK